ncbi:MAG: hypothetical protein JWO75_6561 [Actinomycetia bacterium]|nr:hypothetical protein [Actinomycetes bacterium]
MPEEAGQRAAEDGVGLGLLEAETAHRGDLRGRIGHRPVRAVDHAVRPVAADQRPDPLPVQVRQPWRPGRLQVGAGADDQLVGLAEPVVAAEVAGDERQLGHRVERRAQRGRRPPVAGLVRPARAGVRDHRDAGLRQRVQQLDHPRLVQRQVLEQRVQLDPADAVVLQRPDVDGGGQVGVDGAERGEHRAVHGADPLVGALDGPGDVGDAEHHRVADPGGGHGGAQPGDGAVVHRVKARGPGGEHFLGDVVGPHVAVRVDDHAWLPCWPAPCRLTSWRASESRMTSVDPS